MTDREQAEEHFRLGDRYAWTEERYKAALKEYRQALALCPEMAEAHWRIGQIHYFAKKPDYNAALAAFSDAIRISPEWSEGYLWRANTLEEMNKLDEALIEYNNASKLAPDDPRIYISMGVCLNKLKRYPEAIAAYRTGINLKPGYGDTDAHSMLADALESAGLIDEAIREWQLVVKADPAWPSYDYPGKEAKKKLEKYGKKVVMIEEPTKRRKPGKPGWK